MTLADRQPGQSGLIHAVDAAAPGVLRLMTLGLVEGTPGRFLFFKLAAGSDSMWKHRGQQRPPFADTPGPGQESVWDYPRPPALSLEQRPVQVRANDALLAAAEQLIRVLETASPPSVYLAPSTVRLDRLHPVSGSSLCEWKGQAEYLALGPRETPVAWRYPRPSKRFEALAGWISFYPGRVQCTLDGEIVRPQAGGFYGGWITDAIAGPFKGDPGTGGW